MRLLHRVISRVLILIFILIVFLPPAIGIIIEKWLNIGTFFLGVKDSPNLEVVEYKRGWFSSDIVSKIKLNVPDSFGMLSALGIDTQTFPSSFELLMQQHVQHGPIFYAKTTSFDHIFGLLAIHRHLIIPQAEQSSLAKIGISEKLIDQDTTILKFDGKFYSDIVLKQFQTIVPHTDWLLQLPFTHIEIWQDALTPHVQGKIAIDHFTLRSGLTTFLPKVFMEFDLRKDKDGLWLGKHAISLSELKVSDENNETIIVNDVQSNGLINENSGLLNGQKNISFKTIQYEKKTIGPFNLHASMDHINAGAILAMIDTYRDIRLHGELYESQLKQKLLSLLPTAVVPGTTIQVNSLNLETPDGHLQLQAKLMWPTQNFINPSSFEDLVQSARLQASLRIAIPLTQEMEGILARLTYLNQIPTQERQDLEVLNQQVQIAKQQNAYEILGLLQFNFISQEDSDRLIKSMRDDMSYQDYKSQIKDLLLNRKISLGDSYYLDWLYWNVTQSADELSQRLLHHLDITEAQIKNEINQFIQIGYLTKDNNDYVISLARENGVVTVNGKPIS